MIVSTVIECGSAEIVVFAKVRPGSRATREEPGSGPEISRITAVTREEPCRSGTRPRGRACYVSAKHTHPADVNVEDLMNVLGPSAWADVEDALIEAAMDAEPDEPDPDEARDE